MKFLIALVLLSGVALAVLAESGCTKAQGVKIETATVDITLCVLEHEGAPPEVIAAACGGIAVGDVANILARATPELRARLAK